MLALREFANFITLHTASLAATYARLLAENGEGYEQLSADSRRASARKLLKAVVQACEMESSAPLGHLFEESVQPQQPTVPEDQGAIPKSPRWTEAIVPPRPLLELECLGQTLVPVVTSLEAGKFLWQILSDVRTTLLNEDIEGPVFGSSGRASIETDRQKLDPPSAPGDRVEQTQAGLSDLNSRFYEVSGEAVMILDQEGVFDCNQATLDLFGYSSKEDFLKTHPGDQSPPTQPDGRDSRSAADEQIAAAIREGVHRFEWLHRRADGTTFPAELSLTALELDGKPLLQAVVRDITERKQLLAEMETLYQASADLNTVQSYDEILTILRQYTVSGQNAQNISLNYFDRPFTEDQTPEWIIVLSRWSELSPGVVSSRYPVAKFPAIIQLLRSDAASRVEDVSTDPRLDETSRAIYTDRFGAKSTIFAPMVVRGQWVGFLNAIYQQPATFSEAEMRRLTALVGQVAVAVQNLRNITLLEERAAQFEQLVRFESALSQAATEEEILIALAENLDLHPDRLILQYLEMDESGQPILAETVAIWEDGDIKEDDPDLHQRYQLDQISLSKLWIEAPEEVLLFSDVQTDPRIDEELRAFLSHLGVAAYANIPLRSGNRWQGLLALDWSEPRPFDENERTLFRQLLEPVAAVVASRRAFLAQEAARSDSDRRARREQTIREITDKMRAATNLEQLVKTAAEELGQRFSAEYALVELGFETDVGGGDNGQTQ